MKIQIGDAEHFRKLYEDHLYVRGQRTALSEAQRNNPHVGIFSPFYAEHAAKKGPRYDQMRAFNTLIFAAIGIMLQGEKGIYRFGAISKGMRANYLAKMEGPFRYEHEDGEVSEAFHTLDLDENAGSVNYIADVVRPNQQTQMSGIALLQSRKPHRPIIVPVMLQGAALLAGQPNFDRGGKRKDKDYMVLWDPVIVEFMDEFPMQGDWHFSRSSHLEIGRAVLIAAGLESRRPEADMIFQDLNSRDVSLYEIMLKRFEYLVWARDNDFTLDVEPTQLMRDFAIAKFAAEGELPLGNSVFLSGIYKNMGKIKQLQLDAEALILERIQAGKFSVDLKEMEKANPEFVAAVIAARDPDAMHIYGDIASEKLAKSYGIRLYEDEDLRHGAYEAEEIRAARQNVFAAGQDLTARATTAAPDLEGKELTAYAGRSLFSREIIAGLTEREMLQVQGFLGAALTLTPARKPTIFLIADDKYGPKTEHLIAQQNLAYADEAPNIMGGEFISKIRLPHREMIRTAQQELGKIGRVISTLDLQQLFGLFQKLPKYAVAPGEAMPGSAARLLVRHHLYARSPSPIFAFKTGMWEQSNDGIQDMIMATRMQLGLEAGALARSDEVRVCNETGQPINLLDRAKAIWAPLQQAIAAGRPAEDLIEPTTALAHLWAFHRLATDAPLRHYYFSQLKKNDAGVLLPEHDIDWTHVSRDLMDYNASEMTQLWNNEIVPALWGGLAMAVRLRHLEMLGDFTAVLEQEIAAQLILKIGKRQDSVRVAKAGGVVGQLNNGD